MQCPVGGCNFESSEKGVHSHCGKAHSVEENPYKIKCECNYCADKFTVNKSYYENGQGKYCSVECRSMDSRNRIKCKCDNCGSDFEITQSSYENGEDKYCSNECYSSHRTVDKECQYCNDVFTIDKSRDERSDVKYCSMDCLSEDRSIQFKCNYCGDKFRIAQSSVSIGKYCSYKCMGLDNRSSNPDLRDSPEYRQFRETVLERDNHQCVECGDDGDLHVHHVIPIYDDESLATDVENGKTLCVECHAEAHEELGDDHLVELIRSSQESVVV